LDDVKPKVYISRCLGFDHCRFDGAIINNQAVERIKKFVDVVHDCPEMGIGLGVPRRPINIKMGPEEHVLFQPATERDLTEEMQNWVSERLDRIGELNGFILKAKSPSCGMGDVKVYGPTGRGLITGKADGFFGREVRKRFSELALEDEARLQDPTIMDHFLTKLFTLTRFSVARKKGATKNLIDFHSRHKFLLMAYSQKELKELGRMVASQKEEGIDRSWELYSDHLSKAMSKGARYTSHINVLSHCFGYISGRLGEDERGFYLDLLDSYRDDRVPLSTCKEVLRSMIIRFDVEYLKDQYYFRPYPIELAPGYEPKRKRELWR
jgi:uncharacterized protein YbgA (DUF1722 family)/uncharacterized protein YbbK (DUF523 family)